MVALDYRHVRRSFDRDGEQAALYSLLDPRQGSECLGFFRNLDCLRTKPPGDFLCETCSQWCLDPDCRAPNRYGLAPKEPSDEWCRHCLEYIQRLDMPCGNRVSNLPRGGFVRLCHDGFCSDRREAAKQSGWSEYTANAHCFGQLGDEVPRAGFFVYELTSDYVGMTYNPSERQEEHRIRRYVSWQEQHGSSYRNRQQYIRNAIENEAEKFPDRYEEHWRKRRTDRAGIERLIQWLSPMFGSRLDVYRAEWALKAYSFWPEGPRSEYELVRAFSSLPELVLDSAGFSADSNGQVHFTLAWRLSDRLGPSQIVPVDYYELEYWSDGQNKWVSVGAAIQPNGQDGAASYESAWGSNPARSWRIRGVSGGKFPGPWAILNLTEAEISEDLSEFVGISDVAFRLQSNASSAVEISWTTNNHPDNLQFVIERRDLIGGASVEMETSTTPFVDDPHPEGVGRFSYRVRCKWEGILSEWVSDRRNRTVVVGGPTPGEVRSLSYSRVLKMAGRWYG